MRRKKNLILVKGCRHTLHPKLMQKEWKIPCRNNKFLFKKKKSLVQNLQFLAWKWQIFFLSIPIFKSRKKFLSYCDHELKFNTDKVSIADGLPLQIHNRPKRKTHQKKKYIYFTKGKKKTHINHQKVLSEKKKITQ